MARRVETMKKLLIKKIYNILMDAQNCDYFEVRDLCSYVLPKLRFKAVYNYYKQVKKNYSNI